MGWLRAGLLGSLLLATACGGKSGKHGPTDGTAAGTGGDTMKEPGGNGGMPAEPAAGGATSGEPVDTPGAGAAGDSAGAGEGGGPAEPILTFCDQHPHQFCADFDGVLYDEGWDGKDVLGTGSLAPFTNDSTSAPRALLSKVEAPGYNAASATLNVTFPPGAEQYALTFDLFIDEITFDPNYQAAELKLFQVVNGDSSTGLSLTFDQQGDRLWFQAPGGNSGLIWGYIPVQQWVHVELSVTYGALGTGTFDFKLGDADPIQWPSSSLGETAGPIQLKLGLHTNATSYTSSAKYDNVTFDLTP